MPPLPVLLRLVPLLLVLLRPTVARLPPSAVLPPPTAVRLPPPAVPRPPRPALFRLLLLRLPLRPLPLLLLLLPLLAHATKEQRAGGRILRQLLRASIAIVTNCRRRDQSTWRVGHTGHGFRQQLSSSHATIENPLFLLGRPTTVGNTLTSEMYDRLDTLQGTRVELACARIPADIVRVAW